MAEQDKKLKEIEALTGEELEKGEKVEQYLNRIHRSYKGINEEIAKKARELKKDLDSNKAGSDTDKSRLDNLKKEVEILRKKHQQSRSGMQEVLESMREEHDLGKKNGTLSKEELTSLESNIKKQEKKVKNSKEFNKETDESVKKSRSLGEVFKSIGSSIVGMGQGLLNIGNSLTGGFFSVFSQFTSFSGILGFISQTIQELMGREKEFAATTGRTARSMGVDVSYLASTWGQFGVDAATANQTYLQMYSSMSSFTKLGKTERERLVGHTSAMKNFGISADTTGRNYDILTKAMRVSGDQVTNFSDRLMKHAIAAGITPKKMVEEFAAAAPRLAVYGKHAEDVYIRIQKAAKSLGMEMSSLMNIVGEAFDTFEGSAKAAGKLNAILGGNFLNSVEMLNATEDERVMMIKRSMEASGKQFDQLGKYEQKAIASALGIGDMAEANKLFGVSTGELGDDMKKQASSQEQLIQGLKAAADPMKQLSSMFDALRRELMPLIPYIQQFILYLSSPEVKAKIVAFIKDIKGSLSQMWEDFKNTDAYKDLKKGIMEVVDSIKSLDFDNIKAKLLEFWTWVKDKAWEYKEEIILAIIGIGVGFGIVGKILNIAMPGFGKLGLIILGVAAAIGFIIYELRKLAETFKTLNPDQTDKFLSVIKWTLGGIVIAVIALAAAAKIAGPEMVVFGAGVALFGIGIGIAAYGVSKLVEALGTLAEKVGGAFKMALDALAGVFHEIGEAGDKIGKSLVTLLNTVTLERVGLVGKLAFEMKNISDIAEEFNVSNYISFFSIISSLSKETLINLSGVLANLDKLVTNPNLVIASQALSQSISMISSALNEMPDNKKLLLDSVVNTVNKIETIQESSIKPTKDFFEVVGKYYEAQSNAKTADQDAVVQALKELSKSVVGELRQGREEGKNININLAQAGGGTNFLDTFLNDISYGPRKK